MFFTPVQENMDMGPTENFKNGRQIQDGDHKFHYELENNPRDTSDYGKYVPSEINVHS